MEIEQALEKQRELYLSGITLNIKFRKQQLKLLEKSIKANIQELLNAFLTDLNKCEFDVITTEVSFVMQEIKYFKKHLSRLARPKSANTSMLNFPAKAKIIHEPYGQVLIMSPWNYPFQLSLCPLVASIATGNTTILKPSAYSPTVSNVIAKILSVFDPAYISVFLGGREQNQKLLDQKYDLIFFTGSKEVGKLVEQKASEHLCPVILELGGKSPCIVDETANLKTGVKRIVWGKFLNAGQTCIAPDYIFVHENIYEVFIKQAAQTIQEFYYTDGLLNNNFMNIVNNKHMQRLLKLIDKSKVVCGGNIYGQRLEPTILRDVAFQDAIMQEEIFGPIMPIIKYREISDVINYINSNEKPLALYYFTKNKKMAQTIQYVTSSGGVCINDVIMHFTERSLPFGGVGASGMGNYHGKYSFYTFSHAKCVLNKSHSLEINLKYPPYSKNKTNFTYFYLNYQKDKKENNGR